MKKALSVLSLSTFCLLISTLLLPLTLSAQIFQFSGDDIDAQMIPISPKAFQEVGVTLASYIADLNSATIRWSLDGKVVAEGKGLKNYRFTVGNIGESTTLDIDIILFSGQSTKKSIKIRPADVDLVWQSDSFVPPFYKGKQMFSHQNRITFIAFPHMKNGPGGEIDPKDLIYKWSRNGAVSENSSGYGKNIYTYDGPLISRTQNITVEVTSTDSSLRGFARIEVPPIEPDLILYRKNPIYGIEFQRALSGEIDMTGSKEITVIGEPYYFGTLNSFSGELMYKWAINGNPLSNSSQNSGQNSQFNDQSNVQVFRQKEGVTGKALISLSIENVEKILQYASNRFDVKFGEVKQSNPTF